MGRLQAIENAIASINDSVFQELCDSFLTLRNPNYSAFSRTGSQSGKQKTVSGTPDSFILLPNGKYLFIEHSTNISEGPTKLKKDILKCLNAGKTKITSEKIAEIILCVNFNLKTHEVEDLKDLLNETHITLTVYTLNSLSLEICLHHRNLAHQYLELPLDTGQIVSIERFISEYNKASNAISTPLNNSFHHRGENLNELKENILEHDFVILTGSPGVGKTRLVIEGIKSFLSENLSFNAYCISYKNHSLLNDLYQYFDLDKDYILFVDDANRIDAFSQVIGFYRAIRKGKLKIVITVREYAFQDIKMLCQEFYPKRQYIYKLSDEQTVDIIMSTPFDILNQDYHREIIRIADGNPRIAIMSALLAKAKQNIYALMDVSNLFEQYFSTFIKDDGDFSSQTNIKCLGIIAFFHTIPYKNKEITSSILENFEISYGEFIDAVNVLDKLELVEIKFDHIKIPEQNLSTYFFYKAFIKEEILSFKTLLNKFFDSNGKRFNDCVIPANNTFGLRNVMDKIKPHLQNHWNEIQHEQKRTLKFAKHFWYYLQSETLSFLFTIIETLPNIEHPSEYAVYYEKNAFNTEKDEIIELIGNFFRFPDNLKDVLHLAFEYTRKKPEHLPELIHKIRNQLAFDREDEILQFIKQNILFEVLLIGLHNTDKLYESAFYELSKTFLAFKFNHAGSGRNHSFYIYDYIIPNTVIIQDFRKNIWNAIESNFFNHPSKFFEVLSDYAVKRADVIKAILEFDLPFIALIISKHLTTNSFEHCKYVQDLIWLCRRLSISHPSFDSFSKKFINEDYKVFLKIDYDRLRDKESYEFDSLEKYKILKEEEIRTSFVFSNEDEVNKFYQTIRRILKFIKNVWTFNTTIDIIVDENFKANYRVGYDLLKTIIENDNPSNYTPRLSFINQLQTTEKVEELWQLLKSRNFNNERCWELSFYELIDISLVNQEMIYNLLNTITKLRENQTIHLGAFKRFLSIDSNLFKTILGIIVEKNETLGLKLGLWEDVFEEHFTELGDDIKLITKAFIQQSRIRSHFDYEGKGFINILKKDPAFLLEFVDSLFFESILGPAGNDIELSFIWEIDSIEPVLLQVFDLVIRREPFIGILEHFCNAFFNKIPEIAKLRAENFLIEYAKVNYDNPERMNILLDITRHSMKYLYERVILLFLNLTQDVQIFSRIWWRGNGTSASGDVILADIEAADWQNVLSIIKKSPAGFKLIPIKKYVNQQIECCIKQADFERERRFLDPY